MSLVTSRPFCLPPPTRHQSVDRSGRHSDKVMKDGTKTGGRRKSQNLQHKVILVLFLISVCSFLSKRVDSLLDSSLFFRYPLLFYRKLVNSKGDGRPSFDRKVRIKGIKTCPFRKTRLQSSSVVRSSIYSVS